MKLPPPTYSIAWEYLLHVASLTPLLLNLFSAVKSTSPSTRLSFFNRYIFDPITDGDTVFKSIVLTRSRGSHFDDGHISGWIAGAQSTESVYFFRPLTVYLPGRGDIRFLFYFHDRLISDTNQPIKKTAWGFRVESACHDWQQSAEPV